MVVTQQKIYSLKPFRGSSGCMCVPRLFRRFAFEVVAMPFFIGNVLFVLLRLSFKLIRLDGSLSKHRRGSWQIGHSQPTVYIFLIIWVSSLSYQQHENISSYLRSGSLKSILFFFIHHSLLVQHPDSPEDPYHHLVLAMGQGCGGRNARVSRHDIPLLWGFLRVGD